MRKSTIMYRVAFGIGLILCPFVIIADMRNLWWLGPIGVVMLVLFGIAFYAIKLEERGE